VERVFKDIDRRAGYQRQEDEPEIIHCECGARVEHRLNALHHVGPCIIPNENNSHSTKTS